MSASMAQDDRWTGVYYGRQRPDVKEWGGRLPVALVFPQGARSAMSTLGWQAVYRLLDARPELVVERFFWDGTDTPPEACDSGRPLSDFPVIAFSINFEEDYRALAAVLDRAGVSVRRADRPGWPLVLAGGPLAFMNPAPIAPAVDIFWVGEAEAENGFTDLLVHCARHVDAGGEKAAFVQAVCGQDGVFAPGVTIPPARRVVAGKGGQPLANPARSLFVSPESEFRDMFLLEVNRGCPYGCRFCAAGFVYRPPRHADMATLKQAVEDANPVKVGLVGTALTDWPQLLEYLQWLHARGTKFSLASLRADGLTDELLEFLRRTGTRSITLALEGPSHRLRTAVNKHLDQDVLLDAVRRISALKFNHLKLYLIAGWPGETEEDYRELGGFLQRIQDASHQGRGGKKTGLGHITLSVSCLVPKPWTPFQWAPMATEKQLNTAMKRVRSAVKPVKGIRVNTEKPFGARLQGLLARGDEAVFDLVERASAPGMTWKKALRAWDGDMVAYLDQERGVDEVFPWEVIDTRVDRSFLRREWERYTVARASAICPGVDCAKCAACGLGDLV